MLCPVAPMVISKISLVAVTSAPPSVPAPVLIDALRVSNVGAFKGPFLYNDILSSERFVLVVKSVAVTPRQYSISTCLGSFKSSVKYKTPSSTATPVIRFEVLKLRIEPVSHKIISTLLSEGSSSAI